jgi:hypothetical protein
LKAPAAAHVSEKEREDSSFFYFLFSAAVENLKRAAAWEKFQAPILIGTWHGWCIYAPRVFCSSCSTPRMHCASDLRARAANKSSLWIKESGLWCIKKNTRVKKSDAACASCIIKSSRAPRTHHFIKFESRIQTSRPRFISEKNDDHVIK